MRGEGNHKIPGSFAPENMEKTGAERVKYSLACQHEDEIPIKFVPYAQKCPTVLCTFAVALRKESVDRNIMYLLTASAFWMSLSARRAWIEITLVQIIMSGYARSLSARRAWIEMIWCPTWWPGLKSLSARRAWIEMMQFVPITTSDVSLSARRAWIEIHSWWLRCWKLAGRSPQGERG